MDDTAVDISKLYRKLRCLTCKVNNIPTGGGGGTTINGTGFVFANGTSVSYDNSTYLTAADVSTKEDSSNKVTTLASPNNTTYPTTQAVASAGFITSVPAQAFSSITGKPTNLSGYGITDAYPLSGNPSGFITSVPAQSFSSLTGKPTTISGYAISDALSTSVAASTYEPIIATKNTAFNKAFGTTSGTVADGAVANAKFTLPALTAGSVLFSDGTTIAQDNSQLFWDDTNHRLGIGVASPQQVLDVAGSMKMSGSFYGSSGYPFIQQIGPYQLTFGASVFHTYLLFNVRTSSSYIASVDFKLNGNTKLAIRDAGTGFGGVTSPSALVHISAGTAAAGTAPLKLTSGTNLTTPEAGTIEYDGTNYYATPSNGTRYILTRTIIGSAAPATTPAAIGVQFVDSTNKKIYVSTGTTSSSDWTILN